MRLTKLYLDIFIEACVRFFASFTLTFKISKRKATISKETIVFDVWMAAILSYIKHVLQQDVTFRVCKWPIRIETSVIKLNETKLKCLEFCSLHSVTFGARKK